MNERRVDVAITFDDRRRALELIRSMMQVRADAGTLGAEPGESWFLGELNRVMTLIDNDRALRGGLLFEFVKVLWSLMSLFDRPIDPEVLEAFSGMRMLDEALSMEFCELEKGGAT